MKPLSVAKVIDRVKKVQKKKKMLIILIYRSKTQKGDQNLGRLNLILREQLQAKTLLKVKISQRKEFQKLKHRVLKEG